MHAPPLASLAIVVSLCAAPWAATRQTPPPVKRPSHGPAAPVAAPLTEAQALSRLSSAIEHDAVYAPMAIACMTFVVEDREPEAFGIAVREKHGGRCGGDPKTAPVMDRVRIDRRTGAITVYDVLEQDYYSWPEFKKLRSGQGQ